MNAGTAAVLGTAATALYLNAKLHLAKDVKKIIADRTVDAVRVKNAAQNRVSVYYFFEDSVQRNGNTECIWSRDSNYTWNEAYSRVRQYAQWFLSMGVKPHDQVAFYLSNSPDFVFAWLGLLAVGAAPSMINVNLTGKALVHCLRISDAKLLLVDDGNEYQERMNGAMGEIKGSLGMRVARMDMVTVESIRALPAVRPDDSYRAGVKGDWPMIVVYTSGTTGMPKAVAFTHSRTYDRCVRGWWHVSKAGDRWYQPMPMYHGTGAIMAMTVLTQGYTLCIGKKFSTSTFWKDVRDSRATWFVYVGETARYLLAAPPSIDDKNHNCRGMYGNGLRPDVWKRFQERFGIQEVLEFFAASEGMVALQVHAKGDFFTGIVGHHGALLRRKLSNIYVPVRVDATTGDLIRDPKTGFAIREPYEIGGEILMAVDSEKKFVGYLNNEEATKKKFVRDVFRKGDLFYRSGDALRRDRDGRWFFLDRLGDTFRWKGENVSTAEVGEVVGRWPGIQEANVYGVQVPNADGRAGCAAIYIKPEERKDFDFAGLLRHSRTHLPKYAVPLFLRLVKEPTPMHNNKQNKVPLREEGADPAKVSADDKMYWIEKDTYVPFERRHWDALVAGKARL